MTAWRPPAFLGDFAAQGAFLRLWVARILGGSANQMLMVAAAWQMYDLTGSAWDLGLVGLYQFTPVLLFTLLAGHVADRYHRARVVAACLVLQLLAAAVLGAATMREALSRELLLAVSVLLGTARAFQMPSQQSLMASLVPTSLLARATALNSAGTQVAIIGGPALAGLLFVHGGGTVYAVSFALVLAAAVVMVRLQYRQEERAGHSLSVESLLAGVRHVFERRVLLGAVSLDLMAVLLGGATALLPIYAKDILHVGPAGLGALRAAPAVGALLMSIVLARVSLDGRVGRKLLLAVAIFGVCLLVFGLSTSFFLSLVALAGSGAADMVSVVIRQSLVQLDTPDHLRGRVGAVNSIFIGASNQLGEFESGATAALIGPVGSVLLGATGTLLVAAAWCRLFPALLHRDRLQPD